MLVLLFGISILNITGIAGNNLAEKVISLQDINYSLNALATIKLNIQSITPIIAPKLQEYTFNEWANACKKLPFNREIDMHDPSEWPEGILTTSELKSTIKTFVATNATYLTSNNWASNPPKSTNEFFTATAPLGPIQPFVQKFIVPAETQLAFHGDFHGDIHSLIQYIQALQKLGHMEGFNIKNRHKFYLVFLGDYVDRGIYGTEVLYTLMRLKIANPYNVIILRGNHEDITQNRGYFETEFNNRYSHTDLYDQITRVYDLLPVALYLGTGSPINYLLCVHGGLELEFSARNLLSTPYNLAFDWLKLKPANQFPKELAFGFLWSDFNVDSRIPTRPAGRGEDIYSYSKEDTENFLKDHSNSSAGYELKGIFRAHQHGDLGMINSIKSGGGVSKLWRYLSPKSKKLWQNIVATFLVGPDTPYGYYNHYDYDAFGILTMREQFKDWSLEIYNIKNIFDNSLNIINRSIKTKEDFEYEIRKFSQRILEYENLAEQHAALKEKIDNVLISHISPEDRQKYTKNLKRIINDINTIHSYIKKLRNKMSRKTQKFYQSD